jgi:chromosome segregation ATPase
MSNTVLLWGRITTIVVFVVSLFVLYRLLVEQKEATIQLLEKQLVAAKDASPDVLVKQLGERVRVLTEELARLANDRNTSDSQLREKEQQLNEIENARKNQQMKLQRNVEEFQELQNKIELIHQKYEEGLAMRRKRP